MPQYPDELQAELSGLRSWLAGMGVTPDQVQSMLADVDRSSILGHVATLLSGVMSALTSLVFVVTLLIFLAVDGSMFGERLVKHRPGREPALTALGNFAMGTRRYFVVGTVFGGIVAIPAGLLVKALMVDVDPDARWLHLFLGDEPDFSRNDRRAGRRRTASTHARPDQSPGGTGEVGGRP